MPNYTALESRLSVCLGIKGVVSLAKRRLSAYIVSGVRFSRMGNVAVGQLALGCVAQRMPVSSWQVLCRADPLCDDIYHPPHPSCMFWPCRRLALRCGSTRPLLLRVIKSTSRLKIYQTIVYLPIPQPDTAKTTTRLSPISTSPYAEGGLGFATTYCHTKHCQCDGSPMENRRNPFCYYGWGGLLVLIFGCFSFGYAFSRKNFTAHRKGLIIAGGVAFGIICVGIITCVVVSWRRKKAAAFDEEDVVVSQPTRHQPHNEPPMAANPDELHDRTGMDPQQQPKQCISPQQGDNDGLPEKPPPTYSERPDYRINRDPNPTSLLNV